MAEYITKQEVRAALLQRAWKPNEWHDIKRLISSIPPADVRPVVLCDKCRWFDNRGYPNQDPEMPELRMGHCHILGRDVQACWFCATGEREGGDAE
jgi:hypothetical protein